VEVRCEIGGRQYKANLDKGFDISLSFGPGGDNPNAFGIPEAEIGPIQVGSFTGSVALGSGANCDMVRFCAHGNVTHTECIGHITESHENVADCITENFLTADLITVPLRSRNSDFCVEKSDLESLPESPAQAVIVRTLPNDVTKKSKNWSGNQAPFFTEDAISFLRDKGYLHLLTDLPSVDPEEDSGALAAHHQWWNYPNAPRNNASITELIYADNSIADGCYFLSLQFPKIQSDASPSRPMIYPLIAV
jgi:arylformamidase